MFMDLESLKVRKFSDLCASPTCIVMLAYLCNRYFYSPKNHIYDACHFPEEVRHGDVIILYANFGM